MVNESKTEARAAAEAPAKLAAAVADTAVKVAEDSKKAARNARDRARRQANKAATARTATAKTRRAKATRNTRTAQPKPAAAARTERNQNVNFDANNLFNAFAAVPGADRFQSLFSDASERGQDIVRRSQKVAGELAELTRANVEALTEAGRIAATGYRSLSQDALASGRDGIEQASAAVKTLADAKSPTEFFQIQSEIARASFDRAVAEGSKFTEQLVKLAGEAVQPLSNRASLNAERVNELTA